MRIIRQDECGYIWLGTDYGLNQFDGYRFKKYFLNAPEFNDNIIQDIYPDSRGRLWVGTRNGSLYLYDRLSDRFHYFRRRGSQEKRMESVFCLAERLDGRLWVGSVNGLEIFDPESRSFSLHPLWKRITETAHPVVAALAQDDNILWVGTENHGIYRLDLSSESYISYDAGQGAPFGLSCNSITALVIDPWKRLWAATYGGGLNFYDGGRWYAYRGGTTGMDDNLFTVYIDAHKRLYIGSEGGGMYVADLVSFQPDRPAFKQIIHDPNDPDGLSSNNVRSVFRDKRGNLWIGCFRAGVNLQPAHRKPFEGFAFERSNPKSLGNNLVNVIFEDSRGNMWIGTDGGGLNRFDPFTKEFTAFRHKPNQPHSLIHDHVLSIIELDKDLWIGTWGGLARFDPFSGRFDNYCHRNAKELALNNIFHLFSDFHGKIWICSYNGLETFDPKGGRYQTISSADKPILASNWVYTGMQDRRGNLWIGTREGLYRLKRGDWATGTIRFDSFLHHQYDLQRPRPQLVQEIFETRDGSLYVGTMDGLYQYFAEQDSFIRDHRADEAGIVGIVGILEDDHQSLWLATINGLFRYERTGEIRRFDREDGLQSNQLTPAVCKSASGYLYFGSINGFNRFLPNSVVRDAVPPDVVLSDFFLFNHSVPWQHVAGRYDEHHNLVLTIKPHQNAFAFEFAALDFAYPQQCRYAYQMEGLDDEWYFCDASHRLAVYRNLPAGRYTFRVRAANGDGAWNLDGVKVTLQVLPPFWKSNWALLLYLAAASSILWFLKTIITTKAHYDAALRLDEFKLNFFTYLSHEFRTPLTLVLGPTTELLRKGNRLPAGKRKFYEKIITRNTERLRKLIDQVLDLQRMQEEPIRLTEAVVELRSFISRIVESFSFFAESRKINLTFSCEEKELITIADADKLEQIIGNLLS
ncbi:MAG: hypothetical protein ONA69_07260, partial [candidate division KSB1 bacterium]|nr:hypothetical protein [candidate division KSB1 bacterium]